MNEDCILKQFYDFLEEYTGQRAGYWYPLCALKKDVPVAAYNIDNIYSHGEIDQIEKTLRSCDICMVKSFQIQTNCTSLLEKDIIQLLYERDSDGYNFPWYVEAYYFDDSQTWMIYVSHEGTITFTGDKLVKSAEVNIHRRYIYG